MATLQHCSNPCFGKCILRLHVITLWINAPSRQKKCKTFKCVFRSTVQKFIDKSILAGFYNHNYAFLGF